ncbi:Kelch like family member 20, partial [Trichostrongylus colubriformis]
MSSGDAGTSDVLSAFIARRKGQNEENVEGAEHFNEFESSSHNRLLLSQLSEFRDESQLCDVTLVAQGTRINAHRLVLAAASSYFKAMFTNDMAESRLHDIEMVDMDGSTLDSLVSFCYTGKIKINDVNVVSILPAACLLQLHEVQGMCCDFLKKKLTSSNCLGIRAFADTYSCRELRCCADKYILHNFQDVFGNEDFNLLPVCQLLK